MAARPTTSERYMTVGEANRRIGQLRATMDPRSTSGRFVYHVPATGQWITAQREGGIFRLDFFGECPC